MKFFDTALAPRFNILVIPLNSLYGIIAAQDFTVQNQNIVCALA